METLTQQVQRARRRLMGQHLLRLLPWCWFVGLALACVMIVVGKYQPLGVADWVWPAAGLGLGTVAALVWSWLRRRGLIDTAIELDRRFGLKERVSSALALDQETRDSAVGQALWSDAIRRAEKLHVAERFAIRLDRWSWLPLVPATAAFLLALFFQPSTPANQAQATTDPALVKKQVQDSGEALRKKLIERKKEAEERGLKDAEELFAKLERDTQQLTRGENDKKQALVNLNDLAQDLEKRRQALGDSEKFKQQLNQLKDLKPGPAEKLAQAIKNGDLKAAIQELEALKEQIKNGQLDPQARQQLGEQMQQIQQKLSQMAEKHQQQMNELQKQIDQAKQSGQNQQADQLQQQLNKLAQQNPQMKQLEQMAEKMGQCAKCMQQGDSQGATESMQQLENQVSQLQQQLDEMEMLDQAMDEISQAKQGLQGGANRGKQGMPGDGLGEGRGEGFRPEEKTDTKFHDSSVKQKTGKGSAIVVGVTDGPNIKGQVQQEIRTQMDAARTESADPLTGQRLPRDYRDHAKGYFDALRDGQETAAPMK